MIIFEKKEKQGKGTLGAYDVGVTFSKTHGHKGVESKKMLRFSFSCKAVKMICSDGLYAVVGADEEFPNRIYFDKSTEKHGYKMSQTRGNKERFYCTFGSNTKFIDELGFVGFYMLEYDAKQGALYIDKNHKKGE